MGETDRPLGITLIAILFILVAAAIIIVGISDITGLGPTIWQQNIVTLPMVGSYLNMITPYYVPYATIWGIVSIIGGAIPLICAIGLLLLQKWAHTFALLLSIVAIIVLIGIVLIWYLSNDHVKEAFGKF